MDTQSAEVWPSDLTHQMHVITQAQSILTKNKKVGPRLPYEEALKVVEEYKKEKQL